LTVTAECTLTKLTVAASLCRAQARWLTPAIVGVDVSGQQHEWQLVTNTDTPTVERSAGLGWMPNVATAGAAWQG